MNRFKTCLAVLALPLLAACVTKPPEPTQSAPVENHIEPPPPAAFQEGPVSESDYNGLQTYLGLGGTELGFSERAFNTCEAGYGYSSSHACRRLYFAVVNFQLQCRDSNGTISTVDYVTTPVVSDQVKWTWGPKSGTSQTNTEGLGLIRAILPGPAGDQRLRLTVNGDFLILRARDMRRVVAPQEWCEHR